MKAMKADLHVHSRCSRRPSYWILQKLGAAESYIRPEVIYTQAKEKGMTFVTITDHNTIDGCLEIAHLPDVFISEEVTTYFPDNNCKIHILALDITESQHREIQQARASIYELAQYLNDNRILHVVAHPLFSINDRLTAAHFEQLLLLFNHFELNGTRDNYQNSILTDILNNLTPEKMEVLSNRHNLAARGPKPWIKSLTGGSDDHSGNHIARIHTVVTGNGTAADFLNGIRNKQSRAEGKTFHPKMMAHTIYAITYQFYKDKFHLDRFIHKEPFLAFFDNLFNKTGTAARAVGGATESFSPDESEKIFWRSSPLFSNVCIQAARDVLTNDACYKRIACGEVNDMDDKVFQCSRFVNQASDEIIARIGNTVFQKISSGNIFDVFGMLGAGGALYTLLSPYFLSYKLFTKDRCFCRETRDSLTRQPVSQERMHVAHFTDTLLDVNGVARTLQMQTQLAARLDKSLTMITCGPPEQTGTGVRTFTPVGELEMPEYPELKLHYPPLLEMIDYCYEKQFNRIHVATPGPVGLAALMIANILQVPVYGTYHTALPQYVMQLTGDTSLEDWMWKYMVWFYNQMDVVFVPSLATGRELENRGIDPRKIKFYHRGVDTTGFHPSKRNGFYQRKFNIEGSGRKLLYVGRVSKEKNVDQLLTVFPAILQRHPDVHLVIVGDGPYLDGMKAAAGNLPVIFSGYLEGEDLKEIYASSDIFLFPSTTDTFGNVVLEAQASGIPVLVTDQGGPQENLIPEETGFIVPGRDRDAFLEKINFLLDHPARLEQMKQNARKYVEDRSFEAAFTALWKMYQEPVSNPGTLAAPFSLIRN